MTQPRKPFFSVVTITWNDLAGFRATRESVLAQTCHDFEWVVVDGGSTDGTVQELEACEHPALRNVLEGDHGLYEQMDKGLLRSTGDYVIFMNGGDCFASPTVLEQVREGIVSRAGASEENAPDLVYGSAFEEKASGELVLKPARTAAWIHYGMFTHHQAMFYSRRATEGLRFDLSYKIASDYDFTCRIYQRMRSSLEIGIPICTFLRGGVSQTKSHLAREENWRIQRDVLRHSVARRVLTRSAYLLSSFARTRFRSFYDRVRFKQTAHAH
ncbi:MAG TPA: glycosyltransferase family 2 protein [Acidobacteriaceae bacterium]|nr:glycosyltransferase family 2 protein [Acidobacteriaceae bacterium]